MTHRGEQGHCFENTLEPQTQACPKSGLPSCVRKQVLLTVQVTVRWPSFACRLWWHKSWLLGLYQKYSSPWLQVWGLESHCFGDTPGVPSSGLQAPAQQLRSQAGREGPSGFPASWPLPVIDVVTGDNGKDCPPGGSGHHQPEPCGVGRGRGSLLKKTGVAELREGTEDAEQTSASPSSPDHSSNWNYVTRESGTSAVLP